MNKFEKRARNAKIIALFKAGENTADIAARMLLSRQRVYQILFSNDVVSTQGGRAESARARAERAEAASVRRWGMTTAERLAFVALSRRMRAEGAPLYATPAGRFTEQRRNAKARGVPWLLTIGDWWRIWQESGKWDSRGAGAGGYCMARMGDAGSYERGNVFITTIERNSSEGQANKKPLSRALTEARRAAVLVERKKTPPPPLREIAEALGITKTAVCNHITALKKSGLL